MIELSTPELVMARGELVRDRLENMLDALDELETYHVIVQAYGKDSMAIRMSIVKLSASSKSEGQVLTVLYSGNLLQKRSVKNLASGPFGQVKRIMEERENGEA